MYLEFIFISIILLLLILMALLKLKKNGNKPKNNKEITKILICSFVTIFISTLCYIIKNKQLSIIFYSLYLLSTDVLVYFLINFFSVYSGKKRVYNKTKNVMIFLILIDAISLVINSFTKHILNVEYVRLNQFGFYRIIHSKFYLSHFIIVYFLVLFALYIIGIKMIKSKKFYKIKYLFYFIGYFLIIGINLLIRLFDSYIDYSILSYGLLAITIVYFNYKYIPNKIKNKLKNNIIDYLTDTIIGYDIDGNYIFKNNPNKYDKKIIEEIENDVKTIYSIQIKNNDKFSWKKKIIVNGENKYLIITITKLKESKSEIGKYIIIQDRTKEVLKSNEEKYLLTHDSLTNIYNTEKFCLTCKKILENTNEVFYILCSDIKNFKLINDIYGYKMGDKLLTCISDKLEETYKNQKDCVYGRLGKDNFILMIPKSMYFEEMFDNFYIELNEIIGREFKIFVYLGIYEVKDKSIPIRIMIDHAYDAIKQNKNNYKKLIWKYDDSIRENTIKEQKVVSSFNEAIENNEFRMYLQPQADINGNIVGAEALARWCKNDKILSPKEFIPILEKTGLIEKLDKYIWEEAVKTISEWNNEHYISINISPIDLYYNDIVKELNNLIKKYKIDKGRLKLEITESVLMIDVKNRLKIIDKLRKSGFTVEMDDFGSGYSSLNMLKNLNFDYVKLDLGFLIDNRNEEKSKIVLESIIKLCKNIDMKVIIEGVETKKQVEFLKNNNCDLLQGYYYSKPIPVSDYEKKYLRRDDNSEG